MHAQHVCMHAIEGLAARHVLRIFDALEFFWLVPR
jgi:hypothetical protein